jgi:hypothetical protein
MVNWRDNEHTMVNRSDNRCLAEETSLEGALGSSGTTTTPGAPATFSVEIPLLNSSSLIRSSPDMTVILFLCHVKDDFVCKALTEQQLQEHAVKESENVGGEDLRGKREI